MTIDLSQDKEYLTQVHHLIKPAFLQHNRAVSKEDIQTWAFALKLHNVDLIAATSAVMYWLSSSRFFPQPIDIVELAKGETSGNRALHALNDLKKAIENIGPYRCNKESVPDLKDKVLEQTVRDFGGWFRVCEMYEDTESFRTRFLIAYRNNQKALPVIGMSNRLAYVASSNDERAALDFDSDPILGLSQ